MKNIEKTIEEEILKKDVKRSIIEYTIQAMHNTALGQYFSDDVVEKRIRENIEYIDFKTVLNYESPIIEDGILSINKDLLSKDFEYVKEVLASFGIYAVLSNCKKFNVVNDMLATYFSALAINGVNYKHIDQLNCNSFLKHNFIYSNQISIFHELIGEENIAVLCSKIDDKHSFYDNLYKLINYMSIPNSFSKKDFKRLENIMNCIYNQSNKGLGVSKILNIVRNTYGKFKVIMNRFSSKYSFGEFFRFFGEFEDKDFSLKSVNKKYDINLNDIDLSNNDKIGLTKIMNILYNTDLDISDYSDVDSRCREYLDLQYKSLSDLRKGILKKENLVDMLLVSKFVIPLVTKYGVNKQETKSIKNIFPNILKFNKRKVKM